MILTVKSVANVIFYLFQKDLFLHLQKFEKTGLILQQTMCFKNNLSIYFVVVWQKIICSIDFLRSKLR